MIFAQQQSALRAHRSSSVSSISTSLSVTQTQTRTKTVHAGFMSAGPLPGMRGQPGLDAGIVLAFACTKTVTTHVSTYSTYRFSAVRDEDRPQLENPVRAQIKKARKHPAIATLFFQQQTTIQVVTTVSVFYFGFVCSQPRPPAQVRYAAPTPVPQQLPAAPAAAVPAAPTFKSAPTPSVAQTPATPVPERRAPNAPKRVDPSIATSTTKWEDLPNDKKAARFNVWQDLLRDQPQPLKVTMTDPAVEPRRVTAFGMSEDGLTFAAWVNGKVTEISFKDVKRIDPDPLNA